MKEFEVVWEGQVREVYSVRANSLEEAQENWMEGFLAQSESYDGEVVSVEEMED